MDYENVQEVDLSDLEKQDTRLIVFVGKSQAKLPTDLVLAIHAMGERGEYVRLAGNGTNALDFTIAFTIGRLSRDWPDAFFNIISKDTGFDPLIAYLKTLKILAARRETMGEVPALKAAVAKTAAERAAVYIDKLRQPKATRPRTVKTLSNSIRTAFQGVAEGDVAGVVAEMKKTKFIVVDGEKVTYPGA